VEFKRRRWHIKTTKYNTNSRWLESINKWRHRYKHRRDIRFRPIAYKNRDNRCWYRVCRI